MPCAACPSRPARSQACVHLAPRPRRSASGGPPPDDPAVAVLRGSLERGVHAAADQHAPGPPGRTGGGPIGPGVTRVSSPLQTCFICSSWRSNVLPRAFDGNAARARSRPRGRRCRRPSDEPAAGDVVERQRPPWRAGSRSAGAGAIRTVVREPDPLGHGGRRGQRQRAARSSGTRAGRSCRGSRSPCWSARRANSRQRVAGPRRVLHWAGRFRCPSAAP